MDLRFTPEEDAFRKDVRAYLDDLLHGEFASIRGRGGPGDEHAFFDERLAWERRLGADGWTCVGWPTEFGGRGLPLDQQVIYFEEYARAGGPGRLGHIGEGLIGPTLIHFGSPEQQQRFLPAIRSGEELWCQGYSEPDAGSDLANVQTRAVLATDSGGRDEWVLDGQKVWTSYAQFADWGVCLARTDPEAPKHRGISYLVVDMHAPGVEVRPLVQLTGEAEFNEVFLSGVFVPADCLIGPEHDGWRVANSTLSHERGTNPRQLVIHMQLLEELLRMAAANGDLDDVRMGQRLAQAFVEVKIFQLHNLRSISRLSKGQDPGPEGSALKLYWSEMSKRFHDTAMAVLGDASSLGRGADDNPGGGAWQRSWLYYQASSVWAGTNEIQRTILGERVLGLPRPAREQPARAVPRDGARQTPAKTGA